MKFTMTFKSNLVDSLEHVVEPSHARREIGIRGLDYIREKYPDAPIYSVCSTYVDIQDEEIVVPEDIARKLQLFQDGNSVEFEYSDILFPDELSCFEVQKIDKIYRIVVFLDIDLLFKVLIHLNPSIRAIDDDKFYAALKRVD